MRLRHIEFEGTNDHVRSRGNEGTDFFCTLGSLLDGLSIILRKKRNLLLAFRSVWEYRPHGSRKQGDDHPLKEKDEAWRRGSGSA